MVTGGEPDLNDRVVHRGRVPDVDLTGDGVPDHDGAVADRGPLSDVREFRVLLDASVLSPL